MREIKFRGKRIGNGEWFYGSLINNMWTNSKHSDFKEGTPVCEIITGQYDSDNWQDAIEDENNCIKVIPETVSQFTTVEDMYGVDSYFGDIVKYRDDSGKPQIGVISRYEDGWSGFIRAIGGDEEGNQNGVLDHTEFEIIGNIHDNPQLL